MNTQKESLGSKIVALLGILGIIAIAYILIGRELIEVSIIVISMALKGNGLAVLLLVGVVWLGYKIYKERK